MSIRPRLAACVSAAVAALACSTPVLAQSWTGTWNNPALAMTPAGAPGVRGWVDLILDKDIGRPVLFGGSGGSYKNDILQIDFSASRWVEVEPHKPIVAPSGPPCGRDEHAVVFDAENGFYWSFGGSGYACGSQSGTIAAGSTTTTIIGPTLPEVAVDYYRDFVVSVQASPTHYTYVSGYDPTTKTLTLATPIPTVLAGRTFNLNTQGGGGTWSYDTSQRSWRGFGDPSAGYNGANPRNRLSPAFAYSTADTAAVMFGGQINNDTWVLDAITESWVQMRPDGAAGSPPRRSQVTNSMVYDQANDAFVLFGGLCSESRGCNGVAYGQPLNDTWVYRIATNAWTRMLPSTSPNPRWQHALSHDSVNGVIVLFGGAGNDGAILNDTWAYNLGTNSWTQVTAAPAPEPRYLHAAVYDPQLGRHVIYGGNKPGPKTTSEVWTLRLAPSGGNVPPTASFTINPASGPPSTSFALNGSPSSDPDESIASYAWNFGDGTTGTGASVSHTFASAGTFVVTLTVTDNQGATGTATSSVVVTPANMAPTARISIVQSAADTFEFSGSGSTDPDGTIPSYAWSFGDGATGTGVSTSHRYAVPGTYTVGLTITDNAGAPNVATSSVVVSASLVISLQKRVTGVVSGGGSVTAVTANGVPVTYVNGTGGSFEFTLSATSPATFAVVVTATGTGGTTATSTFTVAVP